MFSLRNQLNPAHQKRPINFAVESHDHKNIYALLSDPSVNLDAKYLNRTPINYLCEKITDDDFHEFFLCIKLFVQHFASVNIPNGRGLTPMNTILKNRSLNDVNKETVVTYILDHVKDVDIDSHRNGEARKLLTSLLLDRELPIIQTQDNKQWSFDQLMLCLRDEKETEFLRGLNDVIEPFESIEDRKLVELFAAIEDDETLLTLAVKQGLTIAVERIIRLGANINYSSGPEKPIEIACRFGYWKILEILLNSPKIDVKNVQTPLLIIVVNRNDKKESEMCDYKKCFELLLNHQDIDLNQKDIYDNSALHYAVRNKDRDTILMLLEKGAYIGIKSKFNQFSISNINPKLLEKHFDSCITTNNLRGADDNFEIEFDYKSFIPTEFCKQQHLKDNSSDIIETFSDEMAPFDFISRSNDLKHLIEHPLISSFLYLKWNRLAFIFYLNFILCAIFAISTVLYILQCLEVVQRFEITEILRITSAVIIIYILIREISQLIFSPYVYISSWDNYLEVLLIVFSAVTLYTRAEYRAIAASTILLIAFEIFVLAGSLPFWSFSTHFVMMKTVSISFLRSFLLYSIIIIAFSLSFFTLLHEKNESVELDRNNTSAGDESDNFNKFSDIKLSIIKTLVMLTGEFDAASINFSLNMWSYAVFLTFLFLISTVLFNLLNGLAVSDTQAIISEAELNHHVRRTQVLARYERIFSGRRYIF